MTAQHRLDADARPYEPADLARKPVVEFAEFAALDLRVGRVVSAEPFAAARDPALVLTVDFGPVIGTRTTSAKVANYAPKSLVGRTVVGVVNLPPKRIAGLDSEFLVLGGLEADGTVHLLVPDQALPPGSVVG